jgi:ABC-type Fe3+-hydroxamate transport system substrate-binding protein
VAATPGFEDPSGNAVVLEQLPVTRIVSTMQSANEWLLALGAGGLLVARTDYDRQPEFAALPSIGGGLDPSPEAIAALKPDVVIGWRNRSSVDLQTALAPFGIPVLSFETTDTADAFRQLARLGVLTGRTAAADSLAARMREELVSIGREACAMGAGKGDVLLVLSTEPPQTAGGGTWMTTLLETACLRNAFGDVTTPWPMIGMETITARQPRYILTSRRDTVGTALAELRALPGWRDLKAVRAGRVIEIPGDLFARAGPTLPEAIRAILAERRRLAGR